MQTSSRNPHQADSFSWLLLICLSVLWGGSFIFIGMAVKELPALLIVFVRVGLAAVVLIPILVFAGGGFPKDSRTWLVAGGMSIMNNVIPFSLIVYGQHFVSAGLASVINATTPLFAVAVMALAGLERLSVLKVIGLMLGIAGVAVLKGVGITDLNQESLGIICILAASLSYGVSTLWSKTMLGGIPPLTTATCQLVVSTAIMLPLVFLFSRLELLFDVSWQVWVALAGLAIFSTVIAYLLFFQIIARSGPSFVSLVTMLIPIPAIAMASFFLDEKLTVQELIGAGMIGLALIVIDGRMLGLNRKRHP